MLQSVSKVHAGTGCRRQCSDLMWYCSTSLPVSLLFSSVMTGPSPAFACNFLSSCTFVGYTRCSDGERSVDSIRVATSKWSSTATVCFSRSVLMSSSNRWRVLSANSSVTLLCEGLCVSFKVVPITAVVLASVITVPAVVPYRRYCPRGITVEFSPLPRYYRNPHYRGGITAIPITVSCSSLCTTSISFY